MSGRKKVKKKVSKKMVCKLVHITPELQAKLDELIHQLDEAVEIIKQTCKKELIGDIANAGIAFLEKIVEPKP